MTAVIVGVLTGVGGGVIRDLLAGGVPHLLATPEWYATPAVLGAALYALASSVDFSGPAVTWGCVVLVFLLRLLGLHRGWQVPAPRPPRG